MGIIFTDDIGKVNKEELEALYDTTEDCYSLFSGSFVKLFALEEEKLAGALRVLSEGVETALLVDLAAFPEYGDTLKQALLTEAEKKLTDRRVMVFGKREDLDLYEAAGYGRCKNAWTFFREGFDEADYLPAGFRYENEFEGQKGGGAGKPGEANKDRVITFENGLGPASFEEVNTVLTKAFFGRPHDINKTTKAFTNSEYAVSAFDGERLVGVARAVSDRSAYATILNVAVDPEYQGLNIGKRLVLDLSRNIQARIIVLNTHPGAVGFYNRLPEYRRNRYVFEKHISSGKPVNADISAKTGSDREKAEELRKLRLSAMFTPKGFRFPDEY